MMDFRTNSWNRELDAATDRNGDSIIAKSPADESVWNQPFRYFSPADGEGIPVLAWGERFVYFTVRLDDRVFMCEVPRRPGLEPPVDYVIVD